MTNTEIKKATYKENPTAHFLKIRNGIAYYFADLKHDQVRYEIPVDDMGTADFEFKMKAKLLNRWIVRDE